ncbi:MAG: BTAD domain-containing putative transcriptional regulator [Lachnospiraceae bacterium]
MKKAEETENKKLYVQMFDHLKVEGMGGTLDEGSIRSEMLTKLLVYFFCHYRKDISIQEVTEVLWQEESSDNPTGALKNLMYRLRMLLKKQWPEQEFIITGRSAYRWTDEVEVVTDIEEFEQCCKPAGNLHDAKEQIYRYRKAVELYKGMFLPKHTDEYWIASLSTYYHYMYLTMVKEFGALLEEESRYEELAQVCHVALKIDVLDEDIHCLFVKALVGQNETKLAIEHYQKAINILYENLGVRPSDELRTVYEELLKQNHEQKLDIATIQRELQEEENSGAFLCEYGVFKKTYDLEVRRAGRFGMSVYLSLITVIPTIGVEEESQSYRDLIYTNMEQLKKVLLSSLRSGDVIARYSGTQFIVLLPTCQYETAKKVMNRIDKLFYSENRRSKIRLQYSMNEIEGK